MCTWMRILRFPIEGLAHAIGFRWTAVPLITLMGGILGGLAGFGLQYWCAAITYPVNIGWPPVEQLAGIHTDHV